MENIPTPYGNARKVAVGMAQVLVSEPSNEITRVVDGREFIMQKAASEERSETRRCSITHTRIFIISHRTRIKINWVKSACFPPSSGLVVGLVSDRRRWMVAEEMPLAVDAPH